MSSAKMGAYKMWWCIKLAIESNILAIVFNPPQLLFIVNYVW